MVELVEGNTVDIDIRKYLTTRGWTRISSDRARHESPYSGYLEFDKYPIDPGKVYEISYTISNLTGGVVRVELGGVVLEEDTHSGYYQKIVTSENSDSIKVWSNGDLDLQLFSVKSQITQTEELDRKDTVAYSQPRGGWVSFRSYKPDSGLSMFTDLVTFRGGELWLHSKDAIPNNFYGTQYYSTIKFPIYSVGVKTFNSIAVHSNKVVGTTEDGIISELGDVTDLITTDFSTREGIHYANLLRDKLTNNLITGRYIVVDITDEENKGSKLEIFKVVMKSTISTPNE